MCPYWKGTTQDAGFNCVRWSITCEGFVLRSDVRLTFESRQDRQSYIKAFCHRRNFERCPICRAVEEAKYSDDDDP